MRSSTLLVMWTFWLRPYHPNRFNYPNCLNRPNRLSYLNRHAAVFRGVLDRPSSQRRSLCVCKGRRRRIADWKGGGRTKL